MSIRKVKIEDVASEMLRINDILKELGACVISSNYEADIEQRGNEIYATGSTFHVTFTKADE